MNTKIILSVLAIGGLFIIVSTLTSKGGEPATTVAQNQTEQSAEVATLPADMPTNVPMYPESVLTKTSETTQDGVRNITLSLSTKDSVADVNTWYRGALKQNGWAVTSDRNVGGYILLKGENANVATFMQAANNSDLGAVIITQRIQIK